MENLEHLSDSELRLRLAQYGFPNLPVTDTTRKVLVKKLRKAIEGENTKNRRETVAVSKFSSDEEPEKDEKPSRKQKTPNRRATVAVTEKTSITSNGAAEPVIKTPSRRSTARATPAKEKPVILQEDTDEDVVEVPVTRRSRTTTPTLGKSDTVRTSYKTKVDVVEEVEAESSTSEEIAPPRNPTPVFTQTTTRRTLTTSSNYTKLPEQKPATPSKYGKTSFTTSYNPRNTHKYDDEEEEDDRTEINESDTPYLSNFAKRLSTLRAEPLDPGMEKYRGLRDTAATSSYQTYQQSSYNYKNPTPKPIVAPPKKSGMLKDIGQIFDALDRKYNFRTILYLVFIVMIIVAIYVIFFM